MDRRRLLRLWLSCRGGSPWAGARQRRGRVCLGLLCLLILTGCATTEEQRFPLDYTSGMRASSYRLEMAREALPTYLRIGADAERRGLYTDAAIAYWNAAQSARSLGRFQDALDASQKGVAVAERAEKPWHLALAFLELGHIHSTLNTSLKAIRAYERGARHARECLCLQEEAANYRGLSQAYRRLGNPELARQNAAKAVAILEAAIQVRTMQWSPWGVRGQAWLAGFERTYGLALIGLGQSDLALEQWDSARIVFQKALEIGKRIQVPNVIAQAHRGIGDAAYPKGQFLVAVAHLNEALAALQRPAFVAGVQGKLGRVFRRMGKLPEAEVALRQAIAGIEDMRSLLEFEEYRESFVENKMGAYRNLIQVLFQQGRPAEAFDMSERARARAFLDLLGNKVALSRGRTQALIAEERALQERISALKAQPVDSPALRRELELAREAYQAFLQRVRQLDREQASLLTVEPLTLADVQRLLGPEAVLLEYFVGGGSTLLWVVSRDGMEAIRLRIGRAELARRVNEFRELIASRGKTEDLQRVAQELYRMLVAPAFPAGFPREILVVPHGPLHYLPFHALMTAPGRHLIQETPVYYYSSASLIQFTRAKASNDTSRPFALGNPDLQNPTLNLRYAEREVRALAALFPGTVLITRQDATKANAREHSGRHSIIHFATHAELDGENPLGSALLLAPRPGDDGRLEVQEIFGLDLQASLVVLSACETALGKLSQGDELTGLTRAFIYAGTPSIITTLWKVNDRASYELMREFYRHLKAGRDKAEALRQAQLATLAKSPHPYFWAAYQLTGEPR